MLRKQDRYAVEERWTPELVADGWTPVPDTFLKNYHRLGVTSSEAILLIHIVSHKWDKNLPFPAASTLARRMGVTETAIRNNLRSLEKKKLLQRLPQRGKANRFDLSLLFDRLKHIETETGASSVSLLSIVQPQKKGGQNVRNQ